MPEISASVASALPPIHESADRDSVVIIPACARTKDLIALVHRVLAQGPFDVLVVDDRISGRGADASRHRRQHWPGMACAEGFRCALDAGYEYIFQLDARTAYDLACLPYLRSALEDADVALGSRYVGSRRTDHRAWWRQAASQSSAIYTRRVLGLPFRDLTCGFRGFRRRALQALDLQTLRPSSHACQIEVVYRCSCLGCRIAEVPITCQDHSSKPTAVDWRGVMEALTVVWDLRFFRPPFMKEAMS
jgi:dolichol-phosphate mannosyltransferase